MKKNIILKGAALLVVVLAVLSLVSCDEWINLTIWIQNEAGSGIDIIEAWIENEDGHIEDHFIGTITQGNYEPLQFTEFDVDKYTEMTVYVRIDSGILYSTRGNVAENDWVTVIRYPHDFL